MRLMGGICLGAFLEIDGTGTQATCLLIQCFNLNSNLVVEGADCGETQCLENRVVIPQPLIAYETYKKQELEKKRERRGVREETRRPTLNGQVEGELRRNIQQKTFLKVKTNVRLEEIWTRLYIKGETVYSCQLMHKNYSKY